MKIAVWCRHKDDNIIVLNKPSGLAVQGGTNTTRHIDGLLEALTFEKSEKPKLVHRIDKDTSGILVVAKNDFAHMQLAKQFEIHSIKRKYICFLYSVLRPLNGKIETLISRSEKNRLKMSVSQSKGKKAVTIYRTIKNFSNYASKVECELLTGRTHQIRVHLSHIGCPVRGDFLYGKEQPDQFPGCFALHSAMVELRHPITGQIIRLTSLPEWADGLDTSVLFMDFN